jgi:hypothetical protein
MKGWIIACAVSAGARTLTGKPTPKKASMVTEKTPGCLRGRGKDGYETRQLELANLKVGIEGTNGTMKF